MSLAIAGVDKLRQPLMAGIPEARFMNAQIFDRRGQ
jgi:hypothetical protein